MLPAIVIEKPPRLVRAIKLLAAEDPEEAAILADELSGITAMVAEKFTNERTAEGIQRALLLTVGGVSLGLESIMQEEGEEKDEVALDILIEDGAEYVFQSGFRLIRELAALPEDSLVGEYDLDPVYSQRRLKELFVDLCTADPGESWSGYERYLGQLRQRQQVQAIVHAAQWLRRNHYEGPVSDPDLNAEGVIALAIIFAVEGGGRIVARTGQKEFERFVKSVRKNAPDFETGWAQLLEKVPAPHRAIIAERIQTYRESCTVLKSLVTK
ncbi:MAG TPA: hypothetical protein DCX52_08175, partial [Massilia sp.]|nr:hypothetical protein [Massilia sp.]